MSGKGGSRKKPSRTQRALANKNKLRFADAKQASALSRLGMDPGWTRDAGERKDQYVFRKNGVRRRATVFRDKEGDRVSYIRNTIVAYQLDDRRIFWAEKQAGGDYAISKRFNPAMVGANKLDRVTQRSRNAPATANGYVPLYAMLNTSTVENKNLKGPNGKPLKYVVNKYKIFNDARNGNNQGVITRIPGQIQKYTNDEKYAIAKPPPPPICQGQQMNLKNLDPATSCFLQGMQERLKPVLDAIEKGKAAGADACTATRKQMQPHQQGVYELARAMATRTPEEMGGSRGLLAFHNTGSGKTVSSLGIIMAFFNTERQIILATTPANEADNNLEKYAENLLTFFPERAAEVFKGKRLPNLGDGKAIKAWVNDKSNIEPFTKKIKTYTFFTLASDLGLPKTPGQRGGRNKPRGIDLLVNGGKGSVLIMDEVQSLFTPDPSFKRSTDYLLPKLTDPAVVSKMFVFALTATPGNSVKDIINVLNFVRPSGSPAFTPADAKDPSKFAGLVSYVDIRSDTTRYGTKKVQNIYVPMDGRYYAGFLKSITLTDADLDYAKRVKESKEFGFLSKQRTAGDFLVKSAVAGLFSEAELKAKAAKSIPEAVSINASQVRILSPKLVQMLANVMEMPGKQYIWVAELNTAKVVSQALIKMGYGQVQPGQFKMQTTPGDNSGKKSLQPTAALNGQARRFIMYKKGTANGEDLNEKVLTGYAGYFNNKNNDDGSLCKIMLATETYYQGLDMRALQGVHLVDSLFNATADKQAVGRALRLCGHSGAKVKNVIVHRYFSTPPSAKFNAAALSLKGAAAKKVKDMEPLDRKIRSIPGKNALSGFIMPEGTDPRNIQRYPGVNTYVHISGAQRQQVVTQFELGLKAFAVDCPVFKMTYHRGEPFQCGKVPSVQQTAAPLSSFKNSKNSKNSKKPNKTAAAGGLGWLFGKPKPLISAMNNNRPSAPPMPTTPPKRNNRRPSAPPTKPPKRNNRPSAPPMPARYTKVPPRAPAAKPVNTSAFKFFQLAEQAARKQPAKPRGTKVPGRVLSVPSKAQAPKPKPRQNTKTPNRRPSAPTKTKAQLRREKFNAGLKVALAEAARVNAQKERNRLKMQQQRQRR